MSVENIPTNITMYDINNPIAHNKRMKINTMLMYIKHKSTPCLEHIFFNTLYLFIVDLFCVTIISEMSCHLV